MMMYVGFIIVELELLRCIVLYVKGITVLSIRIALTIKVCLYGKAYL